MSELISEPAAHGFAILPQLPAFHNGTGATPSVVLEQHGRLLNFLKPLLPTQLEAQEKFNPKHFTRQRITDSAKQHYKDDPTVPQCLPIRLLRIVLSRCTNSYRVFLAK